MIFMAQIAYNKLYTTATKSSKVSNTNAQKSQSNYVYKPYRTLNNY